jgi:hypothetical protein
MRHPAICTAVFGTKSDRLRKTEPYASTARRSACHGADGGPALHSPIDAYGQLQRVTARKDFS